MIEQQYYYATGKRKTAVARVRLYRDRGPIVVNGKPIEEAFPWPAWQQLVHLPFLVTNSANEFRVVARTSGGGQVSQADALKHGISRALCEADPTLRLPLKRAGTSDPGRQGEGAQEVRPEACAKGQAVHEALNSLSSPS